MSILKIKDLVHKYVTYGDTEEDKQEIAAINHIDINVGIVAQSVTSFAIGPI